MGLWGSVKKAAKKAAKAANKVQDVAGDVGNIIGNAVNVVGNVISNILTEFPIRIARTFFGRTFLTKVVKAVATWFGDITRQVFNIAALVLRSVFNIIGAILGGAIKIIFGFITLHFKLLLRGLWDIFSSILGFIVMIILEFAALIGIIIAIQVGNREITKDEMSILKLVFRNSLNYDVIRIQQGRAGFLWVFGALETRAFVLGNTIYFKKIGIKDEVLIHEVTHVWQYQKLGITYMGDALTAMFPIVKNEYSWIREISVRGKNDWQNFNREAQGKFLEDLWLQGNNKPIGSISPKLNKNDPFPNPGGFFNIPKGNEVYFDYYEYFSDTKTVKTTPEIGDFTDLTHKTLKTVRKEDIVSGWRPI